MDTNAWLPADGSFFNPEPTLSVVPLTGDANCIVVDQALLQPERLVAWAAAQPFEAPRGYPYPGLVFEAPPAMSARLADFFALHVRQTLGARRTLDLSVRLSMVSTSPQELEPRQWQCHRDRVSNDPRAVLFAASVLYLFRDPALGGTSFYLPRRSALETERMLADSQLLDGPAFTARHGVHPGYMNGRNHWFERVAQVPAAWNRMVFYDGGFFHSADVDEPARLSTDPTQGRLTLNGFFTCKRPAG